MIVTIDSNNILIGEGKIEGNGHSYKVVETFPIDYAEKDYKYSFGKFYPLGAKALNINDINEIQNDLIDLLLDQQEEIILLELGGNDD